mgnify:CR=1|jgi:hypothetical protein
MSAERARKGTLKPPGTRENTALQLLTEHYNSNLEFLREFGVLVLDEKTNLETMVDDGF